MGHILRPGACAERVSADALHELLDQGRSIGAGIASTFKAMASQAFGLATREPEPAADAAANALAGITPDRVDEEELAWLMRRLDARPGFSAAERALLAFLSRANATLAQPLKALSRQCA